jgi:hypothetical protein
VADATVPRPRQDDALSLPEELQKARVPLLSRLPLRLAMLWLGLVLLLAAFLAFGSVRIGAGNWIGRRMPVSQIWAHFLQFLADQGFADWTIVLVAITAIFALVGSAYLLWLAFALPNANHAQPSDDSVAR